MLYHAPLLMHAEYIPDCEMKQNNMEIKDYIGACAMWKLRLLIFLMPIILVGCATAPAPAPMPAQHESVQSYLNTGNYDDAYALAESLFIHNHDKAALTAELFIQDYPESLQYIINFYKKSIDDCREPLDCITLAGRLRAGNKYGLLNEADYTQLFTLLDQSASSKNRANLVPFLLTNDYKTIPSLNEDDNQLIIFRRSVDSLGATLSGPIAERIISVVRSKGKNSHEYAYLLAAIPNLQIPKSIARDDFRELFPGIANKPTIINVSAAASDTDYLYGFNEQLSKYENILLVDKDCAGCFNLVIDKVHFTERVLPEITQAITFDRNDAPQMPAFSGYQYILVTGGYSIEYTFNIFMEKDGVKLVEKKYKGRITDKYQYCESPTIRNNPGSVSPAGFIANMDTSSKCSSGARAVDPEKVYEKVMKGLANVVVSLTIPP
jgi:hypothetical protein